MYLAIGTGTTVEKSPFGNFTPPPPPVTKNGCKKFVTVRGLKLRYKWCNLNLKNLVTFWQTLEQLGAKDTARASLCTWAMCLVFNRLNCAYV